MQKQSESRNEPLTLADILRKNDTTVTREALEQCASEIANERIVYSDEEWRIRQECAEKVRELAESAPSETQRNLNAERYEKLRWLMTRNLPETWKRVEDIAGVGCWEPGWPGFDACVDEIEMHTHRHTAEENK